MKRAIPAITFLSLILTISAGILAAADEGLPEVTVQGEILDMACYMAHEAKGTKHAACALKCLQDGQPMGLLTADGGLYLLYAGHRDASAFESARDMAGKIVVLTGKKVTRNGMNGIEVTAVKPS